jgi:membrane-bound serine protease (ClpP class)
MLTPDVPGVPISYGFILPVAITFAAAFLLLGRLALQSRRAPVVTGVEGLLRTTGQALSRIAPGVAGQVRVHGEIWQARSEASIDAGSPVRVTAVDGLTLTVEAAAASPNRGGA